MDIVVYLIAAAILIVLIVFAVKVRGKTEEGKELTVATRRLDNDTNT